MLTTLLLAATLFAAPGPQPGYVDLTKVVCVSEYNANSLLLTVTSNTFLVVRKDLVEYRGTSLAVPTSAVMMMVVSDPPPVVLKAEWFDADGVRFEIVLNCATYTSLAACEDAFDAAFAESKRRHKPKPANWNVAIDNSKFDPGLGK
jgi:hypothetical protein